MKSPWLVDMKFSYFLLSFLFFPPLHFSSQSTVANRKDSRIGNFHVTEPRWLSRTKDSVRKKDYSATLKPVSIQPKHLLLALTQWMSFKASWYKNSALVPCLIWAKWRYLNLSDNWNILQTYDVICYLY